MSGSTKTATSCPGSGMPGTGCSAPMDAVRSAPALLVAACLAAGAARAADAGWKDPAAYCKAVGTIDAPDARYIGAAVPDWIARALARVAHASADAPLSFFRHASWRCVDGAVLACSYGANIPCDEKANVSRTPAPGSKRYCAEHAGTNVVPAYAAGRATIYEWRCAGGEAVVVRQVLDVDPTGYPTAFWHRVVP